MASQNKKNQSDSSLAKRWSLQHIPVTDVILLLLITRIIFELIPFTKSEYYSNKKKAFFGSNKVPFQKNPVCKQEINLIFLVVFLQASDPKSITMHLFYFTSTILMKMAPNTSSKTVLPPCLFWGTDCKHLPLVLFLLFSFQIWSLTASSGTLTVNSIDY